MTRSDAFWGHVVSDTKGLASQLLSKLKTRKSFGVERGRRYNNHHHLSLQSYLPATLSSSSSSASSHESLASFSDEDQDSTTTAIFIDPKQPAHEMYSSLWEIQLELGEIPDMISNNLLTPCNEHPPSESLEGLNRYFFGPPLSSSSSASRATFHDLVYIQQQEHRGVNRVAKDRYEQNDGEEVEDEKRDEKCADSIESDPSALVVFPSPSFQSSNFSLSSECLLFMFSSSSSSSSQPFAPFIEPMEESSAGSNYRPSHVSSSPLRLDGDGDSEREDVTDGTEVEEEEEDGNIPEEKERDEGFQDLLHPLHHPIYGILGTIGNNLQGVIDEQDAIAAAEAQIGSDLFRHDRKDSGIFFQDEKDLYLQAATSTPIEPLDLLQLLADAQVGDDEWQ